MTPIRTRANVLALGLLGATVLSACGGEAETTDAAAPTPAAASAPASDAAPSPAASTFPVTVKSCGRDYTYTAAPQRVILGAPTSVATMAALGVEKTAIGYVSGDFGPPPEGVDVPELSPAYQAQRESVLAARPDLLLVNGEVQLSGEEGSATIDDLQKANANVYVLGEYCSSGPGASGIDAVYADVRNLGAIFGVAPKAEALNEDLRRRVAAAAARRGSRPAPKVAYVQIFDGKLYALAGAGYAATLDAVGALNVFADIKENFAEISAEKVLTLDADAIVFTYPFDGDQAVARTEVAQLLATSRAVKDGRMVAISNHLTEGAGVTVVEIIEKVAEGLYG